MKQKSTRIIIDPTLTGAGIVGYFDGPALRGLCGGGMVLKFFESHIFQHLMGCGVGTNTRVELLALWGLLKFVYDIGLVSI